VRSLISEFKETEYAMGKMTYRAMSIISLLSGVIAWAIIFIVCSTSWYKNTVTYEYATSYQDMLMNPVDAAITACVLVPVFAFDCFILYKLKAAGESRKKAIAGMVLFLLITVVMIVIEQIGRSQ